jgi:hypothetical protein
MATSADQQIAPPTARTLTLDGLRHDVARVFHTRGILGWGNSAWPGGEAKSLRTGINRLIPGDTDRAAAMYANRFGRSAGDSLGQLGWLKHFSASGKALHALYAIELLRKWAADEQNVVKGAIAAKCLQALTVDGFGFAHKGPKPFESDYLAMVSATARKVYAWQPTSAEDRLQRAIALSYALTSFNGLEATRPRIRDAFDASLPQVVLPDGGHADGTPESLLRLLLQILPLRSAMQSAREPIAPSLNSAIERMLPMLRMLQHGNGDIAHLRGSAPHAEAAALVLSQDDVHGQPMALARQSGFARMAAGHSLLITDTTAVTGFTADFSVGDCGVCESSHANMPPFRKFTSESPAELLSLDEGQLLMTSVQMRGANQSRHIYMSQDGTDIRIEDSADNMDRPFAVVIALKFDVTCDIAAHETVAHLALSNGQRWQLAARGAALHKTGDGRELYLSSVPENGHCAITWALQRR